MPEALFTEVTEKVLALSYEQTILLMEKMLENLRNKQPKNESLSAYEKMENSISTHTMNTMWEELKNDTW